MKKITTIAFAFALASCAAIQKTPVKAEPVKPPQQVQSQPNVLTKDQKAHVKDLLNQAIKEADCSDLASKDDPTCAKQ